MRCAICYHLYNLKNLKNTHGGVLILVKLQAEVGTKNCENGTKSCNAPHMRFGFRSDALIYSFCYNRGESKFHPWSDYL